MRVHVGSILHSYTGGRAEVQAAGATLAALIADVEGRHPGFRFRIVDEQERVRPHIAIFVGGRPTKDLRTKLRPDDEVHILAALSGG